MNKVLIIFLLFWTAIVTASPSSEQACLNYVSNQDGYKSAHKNEDCLKALDEGYGSAQYSVGMGFGYAGDKKLEEKYYRLAADNGVIAAYLALGHYLREESIWESIYWYQRFVQTKTNGYGFAALQLSKLFDTLKDEGQAKYWLTICESSDYEGCSQ